MPVTVLRHSRAFPKIPPWRPLLHSCGLRNAGLVLNGLSQMQYSKNPKVDRSLKHSVRDGMASAAMVGSAETYLSAFAMFFKASASQVALIATLPALLGALGQLLAAWLSRNNGQRKPMIVIGAVMQAAIWLLLVAMTI